MTENALKLTNGKKIALYRAYTKNSDLSSVLYTAPSQFQVGTNNADVTVATTSLDNPIPLSNGTVNDNGDNTLTGSNGADNSTDNITTYKPGAGVTDDTSQNLIANNSSATKTWTIADLSSLGTNITSTKYIGLWIYIKDATALAKFKTSGTCLEIKFGMDTSNYYSITKTAANLATGWNWITSANDTVADLTETGTVAGDIDTFIIEITTNNITDTFIAGDVLYDLLRTWTLTETLKNITTGSPSFNFTTLEVETRCIIGATQANGFLINAIGTYNEDTTILMDGVAKTSEESKSDTDEFIYVAVDRYL